MMPPVPFYARCEHGACARPGCAQCDAPRALERFLDDVASGRDERLRRLPDRPVLVYHVPRTGGTFLSRVFERLGVLLVRPDFPRDAEAVSAQLERGARRGIVILAHTAAALKSRHPDVEFVEYGACWRDPIEICASEYHGIRDATPGHHLFSHHLREQCLACPSVAEWVERYARGNAIRKVVGDNRPHMLRTSSFAADVGEMLRAITGADVDLVRDFGFEPASLRPGRWVSGLDREQLLRLRELNAADFELWDEVVRERRPADRIGASGRSG